MATTSTDSFDAFLSRGLGPRKGMWRIPLPTQSYEHPSKPLSAERLLNLMAEAEPTTARNETALLSTGGLVPNVPTGSFGGSGIIAMNADLPGFNYVLVNGFFYRQSGGGIVNLGPVGVLSYPAGETAATMMATIAVGTNAAVLCVPPDAWLCSHTDTALTSLTGTSPDVSGFPVAGARWVAQLDGYFIFGASDQFDGFFISLLLNPAMYSAFDSASADGVPNVLRRGFIVNRELWLVGEGGIEVWYDAGGDSFPLARRPGGFIGDGPRSIRSCAVGQDDQGRDTFWWISVRGKVYRSSGYAAIPVSTPAIEAIIATAGTTSISRAFCFAHDGHSFYCVTLGTTTLVYDSTTKKWHNRSSSSTGSTAWLPSCSIQLGQDALFGDGTTGNTYKIDSTASADNGTALLRQGTLPPLYSRTSRAFNNRLEIEMEVAGALSPGDITLTWSNDGGHTFTGGPRVMSAGTLTELGKRVVTTRLGSFRQRVYRISFLGHGTIYAVDADIDQPMAGG